MFLAEPLTFVRVRLKEAMDGVWSKVQCYTKVAKSVVCFFITGLLEDDILVGGEDDQTVVRAILR